MTTHQLRVMGIGAHPDDLEFMCAGTLAKYRSQGHQVTMCHITNGNRGATSGNRDDVARIRKAESAAAAAIIGADYMNLGVPDCEVDATNEEQKLLVTEAIRQAKPDLIITHSTGDYMEDHNQASALAFSCSFFATVPLYTTQSPAIETVPAIYYMETMASLAFQPHEFVDVSDYLDIKLAMMREHASQFAWLGAHDDMDVLGQISTVAAFRGIQSGVRYAEAFAPCNVHLRTRTTRLLP